MFSTGSAHRPAETNASELLSLNHLLSSRPPFSGMLLFSHLVVSNSLQSHRLSSARLLRPRDSPGKSTGVGCHRLLHLFGFTDADWANMAAEYNAKSQAFGEDEANNWLRWQIQNTASENQGVLEKYWRGFTGMGASAAGALVSTAGMLYGLEEYIAGDYEDVEGLSTFGNIINAMMDNSVTRYGNDITKWGSLSIAKQREAEELGISNLEIIQKESDVTGTLAQQIFNINTLPVAIQQGGFTVASMATGWGAAKLAGLMFKGAKLATMAGKAGTTTQKLLQARKALETVQKAENFTNKFIIPGVVGTT